MEVKKHFEDGLVIISPNNYKAKIIQEINSLGELIEIKVFSLDEIKKKILFDYDEKTIHYIMTKYKYGYSHAMDIINSIYYTFFDVNQKVFQDIIEIKEDLIRKELLYFDNYFLDSLKDKKVVIFGFYYLTKFDKLIVDKIPSTKIIYDENNVGEIRHNIYQFNNINDEIEFIANDILKKINQGKNLNDIYLANLNNDYLSTVKRVFNFYNININLDSKSSLYDINCSKLLLENINNYEKYLNKINDQAIKSKCINILNNYYWLDNLEDGILMIENDFKNTYLPNQINQNAVNVVNLKEDYLDSDSIIYLIGFASNYLPHNYKDEDFINDYLKPRFIEKTFEKNNIERVTWKVILNSYNNLMITFARQNLKEVLTISPLADGFAIVDKEYQFSSYSHKSNLYNYASLMDNFIKYSVNHNSLGILNFNYQDSYYLSYDNQYTDINPNLIKEHLNNQVKLSYSKMQVYAECRFKYYLEHILKLNPYRGTFEAYLGNLIHEILSKIYRGDFDLEKEKKDFLNNNYFDLTLENHLFINKTCLELESIISNIKKFHQFSDFKEIESEKYINVEKKSDINIIFSGIIDKIMKHGNKLAIIDYKSYDANTDLSLIPHGLNMQLPLYLYLVKNIYPDAEIIGLYVQNVNRVIPNHDFKKSYSELKADSLRLVGYTIDNESIINSFDQTYENSKFISGMRKSSKGFYKYTKLLSQDNFNSLYNFTDKLIADYSNDIINGKFDINPKIVDKKNVSCEYCKFKSICFVSEKDHIYLKKDHELSFLEEDL